MVAGWHSTFLVNSAAHTWGRQPYDTGGCATGGTLREVPWHNQVRVNCQQQDLHLSSNGAGSWHPPSVLQGCGGLCACRRAAVHGASATQPRLNPGCCTYMWLRLLLLSPCVLVSTCRGPVHQLLVGGCRQLWRGLAQHTPRGEHAGPHTRASFWQPLCCVTCSLRVPCPDATIATCGRSRAPLRASECLTTAVHCNLILIMTVACCAVLCRCSSPTLPATAWSGGRLTPPGT
jgi:hypothetical protein